MVGTPDPVSREGSVCAEREGRQLFGAAPLQAYVKHPGSGSARLTPRSHRTSVLDTGDRGWPYGPCGVRGVGRCGSVAALRASSRTIPFASSRQCMWRPLRRRKARQSLRRGATALPRSGSSGPAQPRDRCARSEHPRRAPCRPASCIGARPFRRRFREPAIRRLARFRWPGGRGPA